MQQKAGWLDQYSYKSSIELLKEIALVHAKRAGRFSQILEQHLAASDWDNLLAVEIDYRPDDDATVLYHARQTLALFSKLEPLKLKSTITVTKELAGFRKFAQTERDCLRTNLRFESYRLGTPMGYPYDVILTDAREIIATILGKVPDVDDLDLTFGPGATTTTKRRDSSFRVKLGESPQCSHELAPFVPKLLGSVLPYAVLHSSHEDLDSVFVDVGVANGRLEFVPKDAKIYRSIIVQPGLNTLLQQGYGKWIRRRLKKKAGIDLLSQELNRSLASAGSVSDQLATIDFSSASDTIASQVVAFLLPDGWFTALSLATCRRVDYKGLEISMEKFSSMGCSFTFELESLIFWALARSTMLFLSSECSARSVASRHKKRMDAGYGDGPYTCSIFGDDLIVPSDAYSLCSLVFAFCGFTINDRKSFRKGPFRESCGGDFFKGINIRPYYQKELVTPECLFTLHNFYIRTRQLAMASLVLKFVHPHLHIFGPDGYGDGHLIGDWTPLRKKVVVTEMRGGKKLKHRLFPSELGWEGSFFKSFQCVTSDDLRRHKGDSLLPAYSIYARRPGLQEDPTGHSAYQRMWADQRYLTRPEVIGYKEILIYVLGTQQQAALSPRTLVDPRSIEWLPIRYRCCE